MGPSACCESSHDDSQLGLELGLGIAQDVGGIAHQWGIIAHSGIAFVQRVAARVLSRGLRPFLFLAGPVSEAAVAAC
jgi:hypothetical protein